MLKLISNQRGAFTIFDNNKKLEKMLILSYGRLKIAIFWDFLLHLLVFRKIAQSKNVKNQPPFSEGHNSIKNKDILNFSAININCKASSIS